MALSASVSAYIPTTNNIKHNTRASFVVINTEKRVCKKYRNITVSKYFTLEDLINIEWRSLVFHRVACKYTSLKCVLANVMFVTEDNWKTITKQELYKGLSQKNVWSLAKYPFTWPFFIDRAILLIN